MCRSVRCSPKERNNRWNTPYLFNAKELDEETGLYYYGARYYDPRTSVWISTDPMQEKYPNISTYAYTLLNPIKYVDPDGKDVYIIIHNRGIKFEAAANTRKKEIESMKSFNPENDKVYMLQIGDLGILGTRIKSIIDDATANEYGKTVEAAFYTHSGTDGPNGNVPTSGNYALSKYTGLNLDINQMVDAGWSEINWNFDPQNSIAAFYGCNSSGFASRFLDYSNVAYTAGFSGQSMATYSNEGDFDKLGSWSAMFGTSKNVYFGVNSDGKYLGLDLYRRKKVQYRLYDKIHNVKANIIAETARGAFIKRDVKRRKPKQKRKDG